MRNLYALLMMGLLVDKISGGFVADSVGEPEKCIYETATYQSGEVGGRCNGVPIEITRVSYEFNVCKFESTDFGLGEEGHWKKYYQCDSNALKFMLFETEFGCNVGYESNSKYEPVIFQMNYCELNWWNLLGAPYALS